MNSLSFSIVIIVVIGCFQQSHQAPAIESFTITKATPAGEVQGAKQCGGPAEFKQFRVQGCDASGPCKVKAQKEKMISYIDFIPVIDMTQMSLKVKAHLDGGEPTVVYEETRKDLGVKKGELHTVTVVGTSGERGLGKVHYHIELINAEDQSVRACVSADVEWY